MEVLHHAAIDQFITPLLLLLFPFLASCSGTHKETPTRAIQESAIGWLQGNCLGIKNPDTESGTKVTVVSLDDPQRAVSATVLDQVPTDRNCPPLLADRRAMNLGNGYSFYVLEAATEIQSGIGLVGDGVKIDEYRFDSCTTGEGIRYRLQGKHSSRQTLLWSGYYYLGYDSEASCTEQP